MRVRPGLLIVLALSLALAVYVGSKVAMRPRLRPGERLVFISEMFDRRKTGFAARMTLNAHRFDQLQSMADTLIAGGYTMPSGVPQIHVFHSEGFGTVDDENNAEQWQLHLDRLREWNDARPNSVLARIALAEGLIGRGWAARGEGWGSSVTQDRWRRFHDDIDEAGQILRQCPPEAASNPEWWEDDLQVLHAMGADSLYRVMSDSARRAFPDQWHLYNEMAMHLMPRWYGRTGDWESFAERCASELPPPLGDEVYARILTNQAQSLPNVFHDGGGLSWERTTSGLAAWQRHFPESNRPSSARALLAWEAGQRDEARRAFAQIGDTVDVDLWFDAERFTRARRWADGDDSQAASATRW